MAGRHRLFVRRRDGRVEVRLNDFGRTLARDAFTQVVAAERDADHIWHAGLSAPIDPSVDHDDPVAMLTRQNEMATNAELALVTVGERFLNAAEAWSWLSTMQVALRATALAHGLISDENLAASDESVRSHVLTLQQFLFDLADTL